MKRSIFAIALAIAVSATFAFGFVTEADAKKFTSKACKTTNLAGKKVSFKCAIDEKCCWQVILQKGSCVKAPGICI